MSSNIRVQRICQHCGEEFIAKTTVTKYCGDICAKRAYKERIRVVKITNSNVETNQRKIQPIEVLKKKEYLTITEACAMLSVSRWTLWRAIKRNELVAGKAGTRTIIKRSAIDEYLGYGI